MTLTQQAFARARSADFSGLKGVTIDTPKARRDDMVRRWEIVTGFNRTVTRNENGE